MANQTKVWYKNDLMILAVTGNIVEKTGAWYYWGFEENMLENWYSEDRDLGKCKMGLIYLKENDDVLIKVIEKVRSWE